MRAECFVAFAGGQIVRRQLQLMGYVFGPVLDNRIQVADGVIPAPHVGLDHGLSLQ